MGINDQGMTTRLDKMYFTDIRVSHALAANKVIEIEVHFSVSDLVDSRDGNEMKFSGKFIPNE